MSIFDVLSLLGGLAMFLYGMRLMGDSLKENSSGTLKDIMGRVTDNPVKAFWLGMLVTALIQSSTATIVITSGLVGAGILTLHQSLGIIIGANVGTTVTGQIIRLLDLNTADNTASFLRFLQPSTLAPIALILGMVLIMTSLFKNARSVGSIAVGFGILFSGLMNMTGAVDALTKSGLVERLFAGLGSNPVIGYLTGAGVAFALQSSSATIGILQAFSSGGLLAFKSIYAVIVGIYLGDCVTTAIVCSIGASSDAKRVGIVNILFNLSETVLVLVVITVIHRLGFLDGLWDRTVNSGIIANTNTIFNFACAVCLFPMLGVYEKLSYRIVKDPKPTGETDPYHEIIEGLNPVFFATPALALRSCYQVLATMFRLSRENLDKAQSQLDAYSEAVQKDIAFEESQVDRLTDNLSHYLVELLPYLKNEYHISILNQYYKVSTEFERLGDHAVNIAAIGAKMADSGTAFSEQFLNELSVLKAIVKEILDESERAFQNMDVKAATRIEPKVRVVTELINELTRNHFKRMSAGRCPILADAAFSNLMGEYRRIAAICSNIGITTLVRVRPELADHEHLYFETLEESGDAGYAETFEKTHSLYFDLLRRYEASAPSAAAPSVLPPPQPAM